MSKVVHIIGNGDQASLFHKEKRVGMKLTCNIPPWPVNGVYGTIMVDFKMMRALHKRILYSSTEVRCKLYRF